MFKTLTIAAALTAATATFAVADTSYIVDFDQERAASSSLDIATIRAASDGVVEIYDYHAGSTGALLGSEQVFAGANADTKVNLGRTPIHDVLAVLKVDGQIVDTLEIDLN